MKKLVFISGEDLLDVDLPVVKNIHKNYDFTWIIILKGYGWFSQEKLREFCEENKIPNIILLQHRKIKHPYTVVFHFKLLSILKSLDADLIYDSYLGVPGMHFVSSLFVPKRKFVIAIHDVIQHHKMNNRRIRSIYSSYLMRRFSNLHLFSQNQLALFNTKFRSRDKNILVAPLALKDFGKRSIRQQNFETRTFLFFGIIRENKGLDTFIRAANRLIDMGFKFKAIIAGKAVDDHWNRCESLIRHEQVFDLMIRTINNDEVGQLMSLSDFVVLPYKDVTQSGVLLTAYNYGRPAIASDLPGFNEYINHSENGFLFDPNSVDALVNCMQKVLEMSDDELSTVNKNLEQFVEERINLTAISKKYMDFFDDLLEEPQKVQVKPIEL